jgi:hypothetical protein
MSAALVADLELSKAIGGVRAFSDIYFNPKPRIEAEPLITGLI